MATRQTKRKKSTTSQGHLNLDLKEKLFEQIAAKIPPAHIALLLIWLETGSYHRETILGHLDLKHHELWKEVKRLETTFNVELGNTAGSKPLVDRS